MCLALGCSILKNIKQALISEKCRKIPSKKLAKDDNSSTNSNGLVKIEKNCEKTDGKTG